MINKTVSELREMAKSSGIANYSKLKKDELIEALNQTEIRKPINLVLGAHHGIFLGRNLH